MPRLFLPEPTTHRIRWSGKSRSLSQSHTLSAFRIVRDSGIQAPPVCSIQSAADMPQFFPAPPFIHTSLVLYHTMSLIVVLCRTTIMFLSQKVNRFQNKYFKYPDTFQKVPEQKTLPGTFFRYYCSEQIHKQSNIFFILRAGKFPSSLSAVPFPSVRSESERYLRDIRPLSIYTPDLH